MVKRTFTRPVLQAAAAAIGMMAKRRRTGVVKKPVAKKPRRLVRRRATTAVNYGIPSVTLTKRRRAVRQSQSNDMHQINIRQRAKRPSALTLARASLEDQWYRVQGLSQVDTSVGFVPISSRIDEFANRLLPIHVWDITSTINYLQTTAVSPNAGFQLMQQTGNGCTTLALPSQNEVGALVAGSQWIYENTSGGFDDLPKRKMFHYWTHVKLNLYGVRKRSTKFLVQLVMLKDATADFLNAASTNLQKQKLYDYLAKPLMYNNLQTGDPQTAADIKILKSYETIIGPTTLDEYGAQNTTPHIQTVNWFIWHNRVRKYDWRRDNPGVINPDAAWDIEGGSGHDLRVDPKYRVYVVIRALCPERRTVPNNDLFIAADPISEPSYDYLIRNKWAQST